MNGNQLDIYFMHDKNKSMEKQIEENRMRPEPNGETKENSEKKMEYKWNYY